MSARTRRMLSLITVSLIIAAGSVIVGRITVDTGSARAGGYRAGHDDGYFAGLRVGEAQGREEGRILQEGTALPPGSRQPVQDAFGAGYAAGTNDAFAGYDGGWALSTPYLITVEKATGLIVYRISSRTPVQAGVNYYLCPDGHDLCQQPRR